MRYSKMFGRVLLTTLLIAVLSLFAYPGAPTVQAAGAETLGELAPGSIVVDRTAEWTYRIGENYSGDSFKRAPVEWVVVKQDHFTPGSTLLLSRELVTRHMFNFDQDDNVWSTSNLRNFLRVTFFHHLSENFRDAIVPVTTITGNSQLHGETIFLLSDTELGTVRQSSDGLKINYFNSTTRKPRENVLSHFVTGYWTRSGGWVLGGHNVHIVLLDNGNFLAASPDNPGDLGVRPAVNLASDTRVNADGGVHVINWDPERILIPHRPIGVDPDMLPQTPQVTGITVTGAGGATEVVDGETLQMHAAVSPDNAPDQVNWSVTAGTGNASINAGGLLTGVNPGTVIVLAAAADDSGVTGECVINVVTPETGDAGDPGTPGTPGDEGAPGGEGGLGDNGEPPDEEDIEPVDLTHSIGITMTDDNPERLYFPEDNIAFIITGLGELTEVNVAFGVFTGPREFQDEAVIGGLALVDGYYTVAVPVNGGVAILSGTVQEGPPAGAVGIRLKANPSWSDPIPLTWDDQGMEKYVLVGVEDYSEFAGIIFGAEAEEAEKSGPAGIGGALKGLLGQVAVFVEQNPLLFLGIILALLLLLFLVGIIVIVTRSSRKKYSPAPSSPTPSKPDPASAVSAKDQLKPGSKPDPGSGGESGS